MAGPKVSKWKKGYRDFENVTNMNETLIATINKYVKRDDTLYFLGDFCFKTHADTPLWRSRINCQTFHVCKGNHDHHIDLYRDIFTSVNDVMWCKERKDRPIFLSHYSHRVWEGSHKGYIHLYGHSHSTLPDYGKSMDVGIDVGYKMFGEYRPFSIDEIIKIMDKRRAELPDHHDSETN